MDVFTDSDLLVCTIDVALFIVSISRKMNNKDCKVMNTTLKK
jgi:hypothetical protein